MRRRSFLAALVTPLFPNPVPVRPLVYGSAIWRSERRAVLVGSDWRPRRIWVNGTLAWKAD